MVRRVLPRTVLALSLVSLLTDVSSEMIYPLIPVFLSTVLGANALAIGAIEGTAETVASVLKLASGWWSDRVRRRKPLVVAGYLLSSVLRPMVGLANGAGAVFAIRMGDRVGKGIRTAPRDAILADAVAPEARGRAFGFHRSADHLGAVIGPLVAFVLLGWGGVSLRAVFLLAAIPAALAVLVLVLMVREGTDGNGLVRARVGGGEMLLSGGGPTTPAATHATAAPAASPASSRVSPPIAPPPPPPPLLEPTASDAIARSPATAPLDRRFQAYLGVLLLFTLGNSTDAFLLLRARDLGVSAASIPILWSLLHVVKALSSTPAGALSDRIGRRGLIVAGWLTYAAVYIGFAYADGVLAAWLLFLVYGAYFGLTEGVEKALVADLVPPHARGRAFGSYNLMIGLGALPASLLFGAVWDRFGAGTAFTLGAGVATVAALLLLLVIPARLSPRRA